MDEPPDVDAEPQETNKETTQKPSHGPPRGQTQADRIAREVDGRPPDDGSLLAALKREHPERWNKVVFDQIKAEMAKKSRRA